MAGYSNQKVFILYEDEHLLVVKKPFGMESQRGKSFAMDQESLLRGYLSSKTKTDNPYLAVVHRLDRPVAGVMVYAKTKKAAADLSAQLQTENFSKKYEAVVSGIVPACEGRLEDYLTADKRTGTTSVSSKADPLAKKAVLTWKEIAREEVKSGEILLPYASSPSPEGGWHFLSIFSCGYAYCSRCALWRCKGAWTTRCNRFMCSTIVISTSDNRKILDIFLE